MRNIDLIAKRMIDVMVSTAGIVLTFPLLVAIALCIRATSKGPVFFKQKRLGMKGAVFEIIKFRTMVVSAETMGAGLSVASENDERITGIGRILRASSVDELPQLFNVIKGDMSLVGPRPPVTHFPYNGYENYPEEKRKRFLMRPGITGLAQVAARNRTTWDERIIFDNRYVDNFSLVLDFRILAKTITKVISSEDVYPQEHAGSTTVRGQTTKERE